MGHLGEKVMLLLSCYTKIEYMHRFNNVRL